MSSETENTDAAAVAVAQTDTPRDETPVLSVRERRALLQAQLDDIADAEAKEKADAEKAERAAALSGIEDYEERETARVHAEMTELRADFARLTVAWDRIAVTETGAKVLHRIFGYTAAPQVHPAHALAGYSFAEIEAKARPAGDAHGIATVAHVLDAEERRRIAKIAETVADSRAAVD